MASIDEKIKEKLKEIKEASKEDNKFSAYTVGIPPEKFRPLNIFEAGLASDTLRLKEIEFDLLLAQKYSNKFSKESVEYLTHERRRLKERIRSWKKREYPKTS